MTLHVAVKAILHLYSFLTALLSLNSKSDYLLLCYSAQLLFEICMVPFDMDMHNFIIGIQTEDKYIITVEG